MERDDGVEHSPGTGPTNDEDPGHLTKDPSKATGPYADADLATRPLPQVTPAAGPQTTDPTPSAQTDELNPPPEATMLPMADDPQTVQDVTKLAEALTATTDPADNEIAAPEAQPPGPPADTTRPLPAALVNELEAPDTATADPAEADATATDPNAPQAEATALHPTPEVSADSTPPATDASNEGLTPTTAADSTPQQDTEPVSTTAPTPPKAGRPVDTTRTPAVTTGDIPEADVPSLHHAPPGSEPEAEPRSPAETNTPALPTTAASASATKDLPPTTPSTVTGPTVDEPLEASPPANPTPAPAASIGNVQRTDAQNVSPDDAATGPEAEMGSPAQVDTPTLVASTSGTNAEDEDTDVPEAEATALDHTPPSTADDGSVPPEVDAPAKSESGLEATAPDESDAPAANAESTGLHEPEAGYAVTGPEAEVGTPTLAASTSGSDAEDEDTPKAEATALAHTPPNTGADGVCAELLEVYEGLERRLRDGETKAVGWRGQLAALRAMRERRVAGDWDELARLLLNAEPSDVVWDEAVGEVVQRLLAGRERVLVLAPTDERAREVVQGLGDDVYALLIDGEERPVVAGRPLREMGSNGTVEFRPVKPEDLEPKEPEPEAPEFEAVEARLQGVVVRPVGEAWRQAWVTEAKMLQRGLLWLEQWPRDLATLEALQDARERRREELDAELAGLATRIEETRGAVEEAERAGAQAAEEAERLEEAQAQISAELAGPLSEAQRLQTDADATADEAGRLTRTAEATRARCEALDQRDGQARTELQAAQQQEESLTADLSRARDDLPRAVEEADRLVAESAAADADGHTKYYRLAAAESALAARRRKLTLGQRLHVAAPPPEIKELRAEVKALSKSADEAAERAGQAKQAAERAHGYRTQLESFINEGGARLAQAQEAQRQLGAELARLVPEREAAAADHQEKARLAAEAVQRATQASALAVEAQRVAQEIEGRLAAARQAHEAARAAYERAGAEAEAARTSLAEAGALLERRKVEAEEELSTRSAEFEAATEAEARSREKVQEVCGGDPVDRELLAGYQGRAMARIEQLSHYVEHAETGRAASDEAAEVLLRTADLVCGTPATLGASGAEAEFDVLLLAGAGAFNEADFLVGAVRTRRWVLLGYDGETPSAYSEYADGVRLTRSPFGR
ncbi:hypothetical protein [Actinomadura rugatobispora]|uniref:Chromosome segregation ATPase n=1 Tax=Actinomadura rugatobispora TaxID=1994 RepID=A0ABW1A139_9ACTN|nr:hypothetical protein GCM10010200_041150 [Actinomadura rugatobispora]